MDDSSQQKIGTPNNDLLQPSLEIIAIKWYIIRCHLTIITTECKIWRRQIILPAASINWGDVNAKKGKDGNNVRCRICDVIPHATIVAVMSSRKNKHPYINNVACNNKLTYVTD